MGLLGRLLGRERKTLVSYIIDRHTDEFYEIFLQARGGRISDAEAARRMLEVAAAAGTVGRYYRKTFGREISEMGRRVADGRMSRGEMLETLRWLGFQEERDLR